MICDNRTWEICLARWQIKKEWVSVSLAGYYQYGRRSPACPLADKPHQIGNPTNMQTSPKAQRTQNMNKKWNNPYFGQNFKNYRQTVTSFCEAVAELSTVTNLSSIFSSTRSSVTATISTIFTLTSSTARVTSIKSSKQEWVNQWLTDKARQCYDWVL